MKKLFLTLILAPIFAFSCEKCDNIENDLNFQIYQYSNRLREFEDGGVTSRDIILLVERLHVCCEMRLKHFGY